MQYTTVDRILNKVSSELRGTDLHETDIVDWIGEALEFMELPTTLEESVAFLKVTDFEVDLPPYFQAVVQIAKYNKTKDEIDDSCKTREDYPVVDVKEIKEVEPQSCGESKLLDVLMNRLDAYVPYFDMQWQIIPWTTSAYYKENFSPVRLANHSLFNSIVCSEDESLYSEGCGGAEYNIVGLTHRRLRFSFKEGHVALAYFRTPIDVETGYPLVPDSIHHITAINYYIRWKMAERLDWAGREGFSSKAETNMELWLKYVKQANNEAKMPQSIDDLEDLKNSAMDFIPRNKYDTYFANIGRAEDKKFMDPANRNIKPYG